MAKFGLFEDGESQPSRIYEGDYSETYAEHSQVKILKKARTSKDNDVEVATIKLKPGQSVENVS